MKKENLISEISVLNNFVDDKKSINSDLSINLLKKIKKKLVKDILNKITEVLNDLGWVDEIENIYDILNQCKYIFDDHTNELIIKQLN
jgi:hypothetical protein